MMDFRNMDSQLSQMALLAGRYAQRLANAGCTPDLVRTLVADWHKSVLGISAPVETSADEETSSLEVTNAH